jgi:hypothetical protein
MRFSVTLKDPDAVYEAIQSVSKCEVESSGVSDPEEVAALLELKRQKTSKLLAKWFQYGEYLTVVIDTEAGTCTVVDLI